MGSLRLDQPDERRRGRCSDAELVLLDGREGRVGVRGQRGVVEAHDRNVPRDREAELPGGANHAERHHVAGREHRGRTLAARREGAALPVAALGVEVALADVVPALGEAESRELVAIPLDPVAARRELAAAL